MIGLIAKPYVATIAPSGLSPAWNPTFPAANMLNNDYGRVARTAFQNGSYIFVLDLGSPKPVDVVALLWHTMFQNDLAVCYTNGDPSVYGNFTFIATSGPMTGATRRDVLPFKKFLLTLPDPIVARYWGFTCSTSDATAFQISRAFVGLGAKFAIGPQKASLGAKDMNANVTTEIGEQRSQEDTTLIRPVVSLSFEYGRQSEMEKVLGQYTLGLGVSLPMLICTDLTSPYTQDNIAFGRPEKVVQLDSSIYDVWSFEAVVPSLGI